MSTIRTIDEQIADALSSNTTYNDFRPRWEYLYQSYMGGQEYQDGAYLTRYQLETAAEYQARLRSTPLDNHCASVVQVYNSFLFREEPDRDLGSLEGSPSAESFLRDADLDGRSLDAFMKDVATWASVFGHCWILVAKPNTGAVTLADEQALGVRPYLNLMTPLAVTDWNYRRNAQGVYELDYFKYIEEFTDSGQTIKIWTRETIETIEVDTKNRSIRSDTVEPNGLGYIPAVCAYNMRSNMRGIGVSDITDIADTQRMLYNINSEIEQSIRIDSHPSLVKTPETQAGIGAGSIIQMPDNLDPGLKPYILDYNGAELGAMLSVKQNLVSVIDKMANTGAIRATESRSMSGVAMETEFQLLNAKLSAKADGLELAEEQIWSIFAHYQGTTWDGEIEYPGSFNIRDTEKEFQQLQIAKATATDPAVLAVIDYKLLEALGEEPGELVNIINTLMPIEPADALAVAALLAPDQESESIATDGCPIATQDIGVNLANRQTAIDTANYGPLNPALPNTVFWAAKADMWNTTPATARQSLCGNCSFFDQTTPILDCIDAGLSAGGATGDEWDSVGGGQLGYCEAFDFKCKSTRTCDAWVAGGPITDTTPQQPGA